MHESLTSELRASIQERAGQAADSVIQVRRTRAPWEQIKPERAYWNSPESAIAAILARAFEERAIITRLYRQPSAEGTAQPLTQAQALDLFCPWWNACTPPVHATFGGAYLWATIAWEHHHD